MLSSNVGTPAPRTNLASTLLVFWLFKLGSLKQPVPVDGPSGELFTLQPVGRSVTFKICAASGFRSVGIGAPLTLPNGMAGFVVGAIGAVGDCRLCGLPPLEHAASRTTPTIP